MVIFFSCVSDVDMNSFRHSVAFIFYSMRSVLLYRRVLSVAVLPITFSGCMMIGPDYDKPTLAAPDVWHDAAMAGGSAKRDPLHQWWESYGDSTLNSLVATAEESNRNLATARERLVQARASRQISQSLLFPFVDGTGSATRSRGSENSGLPSRGTTTENWLTGFDVGWELDVWGSGRRLVEASKANVASADELLRDVLVSVRSEVAVTYLEIRTINEQITITQRNLGTQQESLGLANKRFDAGLVPELDVEQAKANNANTAALLPRLRQQRAAAISRLAVLLGKFPDETAKLVGSRSGIPLPSKTLSAGLPADLLRIRPDVRAAERQVAAANAQIGVAKGDLFPRFTLGGTFALQATDSADLLNSASRSYGFGPAFRWNLFNAGRVRSQIRIEESRTREAYSNYENTVLSAVAEVESVMAEISEERKRLDLLEVAVTSARKSRELVTKNYSDGLLPFQNVLDAERVVLQSEGDRAESRGRLSAAYARLYKALGGSAPKPSTSIKS